MGHQTRSNLLGLETAVIPTISHQDLRGSWVWRLTPVQGNSNPQVDALFFVGCFLGLFFSGEKKR